MARPQRPPKARQITRLASRKIAKLAPSAPKEEEEKEPLTHNGFWQRPGGKAAKKKVVNKTSLRFLFLPFSSHLPPHHDFRSSSHLSPLRRRGRNGGFPSLLVRSCVLPSVPSGTIGNCHTRVGRTQRPRPRRPRPNSTVRRKRKYQKKRRM